MYIVLLYSNCFDFNQVNMLYEWTCISKEKKAKPKQNTDELNKCELSTFLSSQQIHTRSVGGLGEQVCGNGFIFGRAR